VDLGLWQKDQQTDVYKEVIGLCNRYEGRICAQEREGISIVQEREGRSVRVYFRTIEKRVYQTLKVASNGTSVLCGKEGMGR